MAPNSISEAGTSSGSCSTVNSNSDSKPIKKGNVNNLNGK